MTITGGVDEVEGTGGGGGGTYVEVGITTGGRVELDTTGAKVELGGGTITTDEGGGDTTPKQNPN